MPRLAPFMCCFVVSLALGVTPVAAQDVIIVVPAETAPSIAEGPAITTSEVELTEPPPPTQFSPGFFSLGLSGLFGTRDDAGDSLHPTWTAGLDVGFRILPWLSLGARRVGYAHASALVGSRHAIGGSPAVELALPVWPRIVPFVQVGAAVQVRFGGAQGRTTGVAPFIGAGVRFFVADIFSIAAESALHVPATDGVLLGHEVMPQGALVLQSGVAFAFHIQ